MDKYIANYVDLIKGTAEDKTDKGLIKIIDSIYEDGFVDAVNEAVDNAVENDKR